jgi:integration host factor subunit alpha
MTLTKAKLAKFLHEKMGIMKSDAYDFVGAFFEEISLHLEKNENVHLSGFGNFHIRDKNPRPGRNPQTGENVPITARRVVTFHPSQKLKEKVTKTLRDQKTE